MDDSVVFSYIVALYTHSQKNTDRWSCAPPSTRASSRSRSPTPSPSRASSNGCVRHRPNRPVPTSTPITSHTPLPHTYNHQAIRQSAQAETFLTSVERLHHYTTLPPEGPARNPSYLPPPGWPDRGEIRVKDLHVRYREDLPIVLHGVGFTIPAGRKVGVVGRTGSGKSSFLLALLRLNDVVQGDISVDGVSLTRLGLADARGGVAWIPQQPDLFAGTLRCVVFLVWGWWWGWRSKDRTAYS